MVSPGMHLVKKIRSPSLKKKISPKLKMLGPSCNQTVNLKTDSKTLYHSRVQRKSVLQLATQHVLAQKSF